MNHFSIEQECFSSHPQIYNVVLTQQHTVNVCPIKTLVFDNSKVVIITAIQHYAKEQYREKTLGLALNLMRIEFLQEENGGNVSESWRKKCRQELVVLD